MAEKQTYAQLYAPRHARVSISGIIGAGKTTLLTSLAKVLGWAVADEPVDERAGSHLTRFYAALDGLAAAKLVMERAAGDIDASAAALRELAHAKEAAAAASFSMQVAILSKRCRTYRHALDAGTDVLLDRSLLEDPLFCKVLFADGIMAPLDMMAYGDLFDLLRSSVGPIDVVVFLDVDPEVALERVRARGRACEAGITVDYLRKLQAEYEGWLKDVSGTKVIRVPWNTYGQTKDVADQILAALGRPPLAAGSNK
jgi:deoxyadenosine/deoxycytidine kinase